MSTSKDASFLIYSFSSNGRFSAALMCHYEPLRIAVIESLELNTWGSDKLGGGWTTKPFETYANRQIGENLPRVRDENSKNVWVAIT